MLFWTFSQWFVPDELRNIIPKESSNNAGAESLKIPLLRSRSLSPSFCVILMLILVCLLQPVGSYCDCTGIEIRILDYSWCYQEHYFFLSVGTMWVAVIILLASIFLCLFILAAWHSMGTSSMRQNTWSAVAYTASASVLGQLPASSSYTTLQYNYSDLNCDTQKMVCQ